MIWVIKAAGATYLLWQGYKAMSARSLISFVATEHPSLVRVFVTGRLSKVLNPKPGLLVVAFIPQVTSPTRGDVPLQMLVYGAILHRARALILQQAAPTNREQAAAQDPYARTGGIPPHGIPPFRPAQVQSVAIILSGLTLRHNAGQCPATPLRQESRYA